MMHFCDYTDRLEIENGELVRVVTANWKGMLQDVFKEYSNGKQTERNIYTSVYAGYRVAFPDDEYYYSDEWYDCDRWLFLGTSEYKHTEELEQFCPTFFRYVIPKYEKAKGYLWNVDVMKAFEVWREHQDIEFLLALGFEQVAFSKSFFKMPKAKQMAFCKFLAAHPECKEWKVTELYNCFNWSCDVNEFASYVKCKDVHCLGNMTFDEFKYLKAPDYLTLNTYRDYKKLCKEAGHSLKDTYWRYPKDLNKAHSKVLREVENIRALKKAEELKSKQADYSKRVRPYLKFNSVIGGYHIYAPELLEDFISQADILHQCIVYCDYQKNVGNSYCLVFIRKGNKPVATAEIKRSGNKIKIGQFYADEEKRNIKPSKKVEEALNEYLKTFKFPKRSKTA